MTVHKYRAAGDLAVGARILDGGRVFVIASAGRDADGNLQLLLEPEVGVDLREQGDGLILFDVPSVMLVTTEHRPLELAPPPDGWESE